MARATVAVASFITLLLELTSTRVLSFVFFNHVVYLTVSLALLGFGISGTLVVILSPAGGLLTRRTLTRLWLGLGLGILIAVASTLAILPEMADASPLAKLCFCYTVWTIPFVFSGAILAIVLSSAPQRVGSLYAFDLGAAGVGCFLFFLLLPAFGAPAVLVLLVALCLTMAVSWSPGVGPDRLALTVLSACVYLAFFSLLRYPTLLDFRCEPYKSMYAHLGHPQAQIVKTTWTPLCRIDTVYQGPTPAHGAPGHDDRTYLAIEQDGDAPTWLFSAHGFRDRAENLQGGNPEISANLVYAIKKQPRVAVIGVGGGADVNYALAAGAQSVTAIELNPATHQLLTTDFADFDGRLMYDPRVDFVNGEGRATLRAEKRKFDNIQLIGIDTFAALSSGAYVLSENYLYTVEAFDEMFDRLNDDGILVHQRWLFDPPRETLRLSAIACEAWKRRGVLDCEKHIILLGGGEPTQLANQRGWWASSLFKKSPFTQEEVKILTESVKALPKNLVLFFPKVFPAEEQRAMEDVYFARENSQHLRAPKDLNALTAAYRTGTEKQFYATYEDNVTPSTDDSPFFFEYHRLNAFGLPTLSVLRGSSVSATLYLILAQATVLLLLAVVWPLFRYRRQGLQVAGAAQYTVYFAAIGFGFMLVEIALVQRCVLFLGNPLYSLPVVLATLLIAAGLGSKLSGDRRWTPRTASIRTGIPLLVLIIAGAYGLAPLFRALLWLPFLFKVLGVIAIAAPFGLLMGTFFPSGLQAVRDAASGFVPWAWGVNGCASVYASIAAILIALVSGFSTVFLIGAVMYACAGAAAFRLAKE
ncbi:MAG TPA: hypothetical protein VGC79_05510 [Polyangiaceae bacterium]